MLKSLHNSHFGSNRHTNNLIFHIASTRPQNTCLFFNFVERQAPCPLDLLIINNLKHISLSRNFIFFWLE